MVACNAADNPDTPFNTAGHIARTVDGSSMKLVYFFCCLFDPFSLHMYYVCNSYKRLNVVREACYMERKIDAVGKE